VSPAGGQGANMSVADAHVLAQVLSAGSRQPVADYERIRRHANERSVGPTRWAARLFALPRWIRPPWLFLHGAHWASARPHRLRGFLEFASTAFLEDARRAPR
jgi:2-polyprenyl-6-methoxyphenol hydroxylase-like FAD-dependent oxidoreductase